MAKLTKGMQLFFIDPADRAVTRVTGLTGFNPGGAPADQVEITDLDELETKNYLKGLRTPGQASGTVLADPTVAAHIRLHEMVEDGSIGNVEWVIGWGDGTVAPTADSNGNFNLPTTRTWYQFDGYVSDFPFDFQLNTVVSTALTIQRSGGGTWQKKTT
jgi:hypothetical protein